MNTATDTTNNTLPQQSSPAATFKHPLMAEINDAPEASQKLTPWEMLKQAFSLVFALQGMKGFKHAADQLETNPFGIILTGFIAIFIFMGLCLSAANIVSHQAKSESAKSEMLIQQSAAQSER